MCLLYELQQHQNRRNKATAESDLSIIYFFLRLLSLISTFLFIFSWRKTKFLTHSLLFFGVITTVYTIVSIVFKKEAYAIIEVDRKNCGGTVEGFNYHGTTVLLIWVESFKRYLLSQVEIKNLTNNADFVFFLNKGVIRCLSNATALNTNQYQFLPCFNELSRRRSRCFIHLPMY